MSLDSWARSYWPIRFCDPISSEWEARWMPFSQKHEMPLSERIPPVFHNYLHLFWPLLIEFQPYHNICIGFHLNHYMTLRKICTTNLSIQDIKVGPCCRLAVLIRIHPILCLKPVGLKKSFFPLCHIHTNSGISLWLYYQKPNLFQDCVSLTNCDW